MTVGELATMFKAEEKWTLPLEIINVQGWKRGQWLDQTGLTWTNPSPNMRSLNAAALYPGVGLIEMTNVSVGRGTATPFGLVGAPWIKADALQQALREEKLSGVDFLPVEFTPTASVFAKEKCHGVRFVLFDRTNFSPVSLGIALATALRKQAPEKFQWKKLSSLMAQPEVVEAVGMAKMRKQIEGLWKADFASFLERRKPFLRYAD